MMAAGETPSPELVAQAGEDGALSRPKAWGLLVSILLGLAAVAYVGSGRSLVSQVKPASRAVHLDHARTALAQLGYEDVAVDTAYGFGVHGDTLSRLNDEGLTEERMDKLSQGEPPVLRFWLRESPSSLVPNSSQGRVNEDNPPQNLPGMVYATFDSRHRLHSLAVVPERDSREDALASEESWDTLLGLTGNDPQTLDDAEAIWTSPRFVAETKAWVENNPEDPSKALRIEAGAVGGRVSYLRSSRNWQEKGEGPPGMAATSSSSGQIVSTLLILLMLLETAATVDNLWMNIPAAAVLFGVIFFSLLRYGLLPLVATVLTLNLAQSFPITLPTADWFFQASGIPMAFLLALAVGAFTISLGRKGWFGSTP